MFLHLLVSSASLAAPPTLPFFEDFGVNTSSSGCSAPWIGECETQWVAFGDANSLQLWEAGSEVAVFIKPKSSTTAANGLYKDFSVSGGIEVVASMDLVVVDPNGGDVTAGVKFMFKNASGTVIGTEFESYSLSSVQLVSVSKIAPAGAQSVRIAIGANQPSNDNNRLAILSVEVEDREPAPSCDAPDCEDCNISCNPPQKLKRNCAQTAPPACVTIDVCECVDPVVGIADSQESSYWSDF